MPPCGHVDPLCSKKKIELKFWIIPSRKFYNAGEFISQVLKGYYMLVGINVVHHVVCVHTVNGLVE